MGGAVINVRRRANIKKNTKCVVRKMCIIIIIITVYFYFKGYINLIKCGSKEIYTVIILKNGFQKY